MLEYQVIYSWREAENAVPDENGLVEITINTAEGPYVIAVPNDETSKASTVAQVWAAKGKPPA